MINPKVTVAVFVVLAVLPVSVHSQEHDLQPLIRTYKTIGTTTLKAHLFLPPDPKPPGAAKQDPRPAIILLHGGGWVSGTPEWLYDDGKHYAARGMVAIAGEYRLSDQKTITPLEAMSDVRDLIRWLRQNAAEFHVDPQRIAVYGVSAGGHLSASAAVFPHNDESTLSAIPNALLFLSPAASIVNDHWPQILLGSRAQVKDISPAEHIDRQLPPVLIIEGAADTETPLAGVQRFCDAAHQAGGVCELHIYPGVGHILTRNLDPQAQEDGPFDPDPTAMDDAHAKEDAFLAHLGYLK